MIHILWYVSSLLHILYISIVIYIVVYITTLYISNSVLGMMKQDYDASTSEIEGGG